ncbi:MAG: hypothetical protein AAGC55_18195, partial [Myxococcota bacterium]
MDDPITLSDLLETADLRDVLQSFTAMHRVPVSVVECSGESSRLLATTARSEDDVMPATGSRIGAIAAGDPQDDSRASGGSLYVVPVDHQGQLVAKVAVGPYIAP